MAGSHPDPPGHRLDYDRNSVVVWYDSLATAPSDIHTLTQAEREDLNDENDDYGIYAPSVGGGVWFAVIIFPDVHDVDAYFAAGAPGGNLDAVSTSQDTTNGLDGTWLNREPTPPGVVYGSVSPEYRDNTDTFVPQAQAVKAIRIRHSGNIGDELRAFHVYGAPATSASQNRLRFWDPQLNQEVATDWFDVGDTPKGSSADFQFRIKNKSSTIVAENVEMQSDALTDTTPTVPGQWLFSYAGGPFKGVCPIGDLAPGAVSGVITARRVTPQGATDGPWACRFYATTDTVTIRDVSEYAYYGDVNSDVPVPHVWYAYPSSGRGGDPVVVVGHGFGDTQPTYNGEVQYAGGAMAVTDWTGVAADVDAYTDDRRIDPLLDIATMEHQRIEATIPADAEDDFIGVETDA